MKSKDKFLADIDVAMGGRAAEELFFGNSAITTGCGSDLKQATNVVYRMIMMSGMGSSFLTARLSKISEIKRGEIESEIRQTLEVG